MTVVASARDINSGIFNALTNDPGLQGMGITGVFRGVAPEEQASPFITFSRSTGAPEYVLGATPNAVLEAHTYTIKAVVRGTNGGDLANQISDRNDYVLRSGITLGQGVLLLCRKSSDVDYSEIEAGVTFWHVGGVYEIEVN